MKFCRFASVASLAFFAAATLSAHAASIVTNGSFSSGLTGWTSSGGGTTPGIGITVLTLGGSNSDGYGDNIADTPGGSSHAAYFVDDNANETLSQNVTLAADTTYDLTFALYATSSGAGNEFNFDLTDSLGDPTVIASSSFPNTAVPVGTWTEESLIFTTGAAGSYDMAFNFTSGDTPAKDVLLGDVAINTSPVPEPSTLMLFGTGLIGAAGAFRRRFTR